MCYHAEVGRYASKGAGEPENGGALEHRSLGVGGVADPKMTLPHVSYHVKFGSSATKFVRINKKGTPKIEKRWNAVRKDCAVQCRFLSLSYVVFCSCTQLPSFA